VRGATQVEGAVFGHPLMGVQAAGFGDRPTCGAIDDLLA
jgi:hypothetical protein